MDRNDQTRASRVRNKAIKMAERAAESQAAQNAERLKKVENNQKLKTAQEKKAKQLASATKSKAAAASIIHAENFFQLTNSDEQRALKSHVEKNYDIHACSRSLMNNFLRSALQDISDEVTKTTQNDLEEANNFIRLMEKNQIRNAKVLLKKQIEKSGTETRAVLIPLGFKNNSVDHEFKGVVTYNETAETYNITICNPMLSTGIAKSYTITASQIDDFLDFSIEVLTNYVENSNAYYDMLTSRIGAGEDFRVDQTYKEHIHCTFNNTMIAFQQVFGEGFVSKLHDHLKTVVK